MKRLPGYAVRQNSKSDLVQEPVMLELVEHPLALSALGAPLSEKVELSGSGVNDDSCDGDSPRAEKPQSSANKQKPAKAANP